MIASNDVSVFIDPASRHFLRNELFNPDNVHNVEGAHEPYFLLRDTFRNAGIEVNTADYLLSERNLKKHNLYFSLGHITNWEAISRIPNTIMSALFTIEAPIVTPSLYRKLPILSRHFRRIFSFTTPEALSRYGCGNLQFRKYHIPYQRSEPIDELWNNLDRKFLTLLNYNRLCRRSWQELYTERLRAVDYFSKFGDIDLYGFAWDKPPYRVGDTWIPATLTRINRYLRQNVPFLKMHPFQDAIRRAYRGPAASKYVTQSEYTFTICYENMMLPGWLNENIFDCFVVGTVPVFLGPPDITDYVPAECFIDKRKFPTYAELRNYLKSLGTKEIRTYKENGRDFLRSAKMKPFTGPSFVKHFTDAASEDLGFEISPVLKETMSRQLTR